MRALAATSALREGSTASDTVPASPPVASERSSPRDVISPPIPVMTSVTTPTPPSISSRGGDDALDDGVVPGQIERHLPHLAQGIDRQLRIGRRFQLLVVGQVREDPVTQLHVAVALEHLDDASFLGIIERGGRFDLNVAPVAQHAVAVHVPDQMGDHARVAIQCGPELVGGHRGPVGPMDAVAGVVGQHDDQFAAIIRRRQLATQEDHLFRVDRPFRVEPGRAGNCGTAGIQRDQAQPGHGAKTLYQVLPGWSAAKP